jgi:transposase
MKKGAWANIPPKSNRSDPICFSPYLYRARTLVERFFNRIKKCRRVLTRTTGWPPTTLPSFNSLQSGNGCVFMIRVLVYLAVIRLISPSSSDVSVQPAAAAFCST